jgi:hypothetical protein
VFGNCKILFGQSADARPARSAQEILFEAAKLAFLSPSMHFDVAATEVSDITSDAPPFGGIESEVTIADTLNTSAYEIALALKHGETPRKLIPQGIVQAVSP